VQDRSAASAVLLWPPDAGPTSVIQPGLEGPQIVDPLVGIRKKVSKLGQFAGVVSEPLTKLDSYSEG
jgi:hypothetical protein